MSDFPEEVMRLLKAVTRKRPRTVIDHILKYGYITTEELKELYGYNHPPRAARDVRESGIPLETFWVTGSDGRKIGAYRFGDFEKIRPRRVDGRTTLSSEIKNELIERHGSKCFIYLEKMEASALQIDHRIPYEIAGDFTEARPEDFMLLSAAANRAKSWSCEHCPNWLQEKDAEVCASCYWAYPENYTHVAMLPLRRIDLMWQGEEIKEYEQLQQGATTFGVSVPAYVKEIIRRAVSSDE